MSKYLVVDFGESGIIYLVKNKGIDSSQQDILKYSKSVQTGSAIQNGNSSNNYTIHLVEITSKIADLCNEYKVDEIVLNFPSIHNKIEIVPKGTKFENLHKELVNLDKTYRTNNIVLHGSLSKSSTGNIIVPVSIVQREYENLIKTLPKGIKISVTTNFTRLLFKAKRLIGQYNIDEDFAVLDCGYSSSRILIVDKHSTPTGYYEVDFCGREIINRMEMTNITQAINSFNARENFKPAMPYINNNISDVTGVLRTNANHCKIFMFGGLATLPWHKLLKEFQLLPINIPVSRDSCPPEVLNKLELLLDTDSSSCRFITKSIQSLQEDVEEYEDEEELEEEEYIEEKPKKKVKPKKVKTKKAKPKVQEDEEGEEYVENPKKSKKKKSKPKSKKAKIREEDEYSEDDYEDDYYEKPKKKKSSKNNKGLIIIIASVITVGILVTISFSMFLDYKSNNQRPTVETADTEGNVSLTSYVKRVITSKGVNVSTVNNVVEGNLETLYIGVVNIDGEQLNDVTQTLEEECNVELLSVSEVTTEGKLDANLKISYK